MREIVIIFPFDTKEQKLLIIKEYIHGYQKSFWKYVSGGVDKEGKDILTHAKEELAEELALGSDSFYHIHSMEKVFGNRGTHFFVAEDPYILEHPPENPDTDIIEETRWVSYKEFMDMLDVKELRWDEASMAAFMVFRKYMNK